MCLRARAMLARTGKGSPPVWNTSSFTAIEEGIRQGEAETEKRIRIMKLYQGRTGVVNPLIEHYKNDPEICRLRESPSDTSSNPDCKRTGNSQMKRSHAPVVALLPSRVGQRSIRSSCRFSLSPRSKPHSHKSMYETHRVFVFVRARRCAPPPRAREIGADT